MADTLSLVIGGTSGIGRAIALRFAAEGHRVLVAGRDAARGAAVAQDCLAAGAPAAVFLPVDVGDPASVEALGVAVQSAHGVPDILVNCAGILQSGKRVLDQPLDEDERLWRINYRGTLVGAQVFGRMMAVRGSGAILNQFYDEKLVDQMKLRISNGNKNVLVLEGRPVRRAVQIEEGARRIWKKYNHSDDFEIAEKMF